MRTPVMTWKLVVVTVACLTTVGAWAASDELSRAQTLFEQRQYAAAQAAVDGIDRAKLSDSQRRQLDELLRELPQAIEKNNQALSDKQKGDAAFDAGRLAEADKHYAAIEANLYAETWLRDAAAAQRDRIRRQQAHAAAGPVRTTANKPALAAQNQPTGGGSVTVTRRDGVTAPPPSANEPAANAPQGNAASVVQVGPSSGPPATAGAGATQPLTVVDEMALNDRLLWQRAVAKMQEAAAKIDEAIAAERFDEARRLAETAIQLIEANRGYADPPSLYEAARAQALELRTRVEQAYDNYSVRKATIEQAAIAKAIEERRIQQEQQRREKIEQLFNTAAQLEKERRYREAAETVRQILYLDPANANADFFLDKYEQYATLYDQMQIDRDTSRELGQSVLQADEARIPWTNEILYPRNWLDISARRDRTTGLPRPDEDFDLNRQLDEMQPDVNLRDEPLERVIDTLRESSGLNVSVDWEDLRNHGIERDKPISLRLADVRMRTVLRELLNQAGGDVPLSYAIADGVLRVATSGKLDRDKFVRVYDVRDLIVTIPLFAYDALTPQAASDRSPTEWRNLFGPAAPAGAADESVGGSPAQKRNSSELVDVIRDNVSPDSWREVGGGDAAIRELNGQLIIYQTSDAHRQVRDLLGQLREQRALMISVESRFLRVASNFLEQIGVDLDFVFNSGNAGYDRAFTTQGIPIIDPATGAAVLVPREFSQIGRLPATPTAGLPFQAPTTPASPYTNPAFVPAAGGGIPSSEYMTPVSLGNRSVNLVDPATITTGVPGSFAQPGFLPAMSVAGSFLDNLQVDFLIRATQANRRSSVVQAPRLMLFNGQRAYIAIQRTRQYVSTVTPVVAEGAVGVQPTLATISSGTSLDIDGTISADRKYVTLTVRTSFSEEPILERFQVQQPSGNSPGIFVTTTDQQTRVINTTVSVPDGGTVLIGGLKQSAEVEIDAGVPILSKIPLLKRAFTNTTTVKDTETLLILIKAKILIQKEAEEEAFPILSEAAAG